VKQESALLENEAFGSILRASRERQGVSLHDLAELTGVASSFWRALEQNEPSLWSDPEPTSSYVRRYAEVLGLDAELMVERFRSLRPRESGGVEALLRAHPALVHELL